MTSFPKVPRVEDFPYTKSEQNLGIPTTIGDAAYENFQSQLQKQETIVCPYYYLGDWWPNKGDEFHSWAWSPLVFYSWGKEKDPPNTPTSQLYFKF